MSFDSTELTVLGQSVQSLYTQYASNTYVVNRRYQRKLVWSIGEKQSLIDSIRSNLPIPLILLAENYDEGRGRFEIIDGLQRLNSVFSFLENEFPYEGSYFDLETLADTKFKRDASRLEQKQPVLDRETCLAIVNYQLPVSTYRSASNESVDEVFRRINSSGQKLSLQEIRQAGVTSDLASLVRRVSASVRGDASLSDLVPMSEMPKISITSRELPYGIPSEDVFWVKNGILDKDAVRESRDEELVLDILLDMILDPIAVSGTAYRNSSYGRDTNATTSAGTVASRLATLSTEMIESRFLAVLDIMQQVVAQSQTPWAPWVITQQNPRGIPRYFHAMFIAIHELLVDEQRELEDIEGLSKALHHFWDQDLSIPAGGGNWGANRKRPLFNAIKGQLRSFFKESDDPLTVQGKQSATQFEVTLQMAVTEQSLFDLKQGFTRLDHDKKFDEEAFNSMLRTASAMANHGKDVEGFIIYGVADTESDAARVRSIYGIEPFGFGNFSITGTSHEISAFGVSRDQFMRTLTQKILSSKLEPNFASRLASTLTVFEYQGYLIWSLHPKAGQEPTSWDGKFYVRHGSSTDEVTGAKVVDLMRRFL